MPVVRSGHGEQFGMHLPAPARIGGRSAGVRGSETKLVTATGARPSAPQPKFFHAA